MTLTHHSLSAVSLPPAGRRRAFVLALACMALAALVVANSPQADAASFRYVRGWSVQSGWLCYGFAGGRWNCTQHWHRDAAGHYISERPSFVPSQTASGTGSTSSGRAGGSGSSSSGGQQSHAAGLPCRETVRWPTTIRQWAVPSGCYANVYTPNPRNYPARPSYGWCNWWPEVLHPELSGYAALHRPDHRTPRVGATIWFPPGVQGAGSGGHYGYVVAIAPDGKWVLSSEMNMYWRGGGFKKVLFRYVQVDGRVSFRY